MFELNKTEEIKKLIAITKSDSGISGPELAKAHIRLGELLAEHIPYKPEETTVVSIMRGGIFFAQGIYFRLGCKLQIYNPKLEEFIRPETKHVILVDSVINTGKTIKKIIQPGMVIACCVINNDIVNDFAEQLYTVRVSDNFFIGSNVKKQIGIIGPDTTGRLFGLI